MLAVTPDYTPKMEDAPVAMQRRNNQSCRYYRPDLGQKFGYIWDANCTFDGAGDLLGLDGTGAFVGWGLFGMVAATTLVSLATTLAFHIHEPEQPKWRPGLIVGGGFLATWILTGLIRQKMVSEIAPAPASAGGQ